MSSYESALVVLVPQSEAVVRPFRDRYDHSAAEGVPAHITLLYPFKPPDEIDDATLGKLRKCFLSRGPMQFSLSTSRRLPTGVLYLSPRPDEPFRQLTLAIWDLFPETPPYGGKWPDIVPHLTVAQLANEQEFAAVAEAFAKASHGKLPIDATATEVALMDNRSGLWTVRATFSFGTSS